MTIFVQMSVDRVQIMPNVRAHMTSSFEDIRPFLGVGVTISCLQITAPRIIGILPANITSTT